jgi:hypothetical protein
MNKTIRGFVGLALSLTCAPAFAGIADSPLPVLQAGVNTLHLYSVPGVVNDGGANLGTYFSCTSTSTSTISVAVEMFGAAGGSPLNDAATQVLTVVAGGTVTFGTSPAAAIFVDEVVSPGILHRGSARVLATSKSLICTAFIADYGTNPPASMVELTIVAKTKQKAAN